MIRNLKLLSITIEQKSRELLEISLYQALQILKNIVIYLILPSDNKSKISPQTYNQHQSQF